MKFFIVSAVWTVKLTCIVLTQAWVRAYGGHTITSRLGLLSTGSTICCLAGSVSLYALPPVNSFLCGSYLGAGFFSFA